MTGAEEDEGIERAAIAMCWCTRPPLMDRNISAEMFWRQHSLKDQRIWMIRARAGIEAWERFCEEVEHEQSGS